MSFTTPVDVRQYTGIKPADLGFADVTELDAWLSARLVEIDDLINVYVFGVYATDIWSEGEQPAGVSAIALDMARNTVMLMVVSRETPIVFMGDMKARIMEPDIFTESVRTALDIYKTSIAEGAEGGAGGAGSSGNPHWYNVVRMFRVRRVEEMPEA